MQNKEKILYTKYSNDRAASFRIATQIIERGGTKIVRKSAMEAASRSHIIAMKKHEAVLNEMFAGAKFKANKIIAFGDDFVDFEYLEGTSYDQILDGYLKNKNMDGFYSAVKFFFDELDKLATSEFHKNEKTIEVFGHDSFLEGEKAVPVGDIDQIFQNVIVDSDGNWNVIDYEWTFDFALPVNYIKFRCFSNFLNSQSRALFFPETSLYERFGISKEVCAHFWCVELKGFQNWLRNGRFLEFSQIIRKTTINPYAIEHQDFIDVFYDTGNGFSEAEKDRFFQFPFVIFTKENLRSIRIDPSDHYCIASDISIKAGDDTIDFTTNAYMQKNGSYFFNTTDSQIYVEPPKNGVQTLYVNMLVSPINENTALEIERQSAEIQKLQAIAEDFRLHLEREIQQADFALQQKQQEITAIYSSRSWKLTKPLRVCGKLFRKILRKV